MLFSRIREEVFWGGCSSLGRKVVEGHLAGWRGAMISQKLERG